MPAATHQVLYCMVPGELSLGSLMVMVVPGVGPPTVVCQ